MIHQAAYGSPADMRLALVVARVADRETYRDLLRCILNPPPLVGRAIRYCRDGVEV